MMRFLSALSIAVFALLLPASARPNVIETTVQQRVVRHGAKVETESLGHTGVHPGDILRYTYTYRNKGDSPAVNVVAFGKISNRVTYLTGSATPGSPEFSLDGKHWSVRPMVSRKDAQGHLIVKPASPTLYRAIRWHVKQALRPGASFHVSYEVRVL